MSQAGFFDFDQRLDQLNAHGNPLDVVAHAVDFELFRDTLMTVRDKPRKDNSGRRPFDVVLMFRMLVLQALYNLADGQLEYQVRDRVSFMAFLGLRPGDVVPDEKTVWLFREDLKRLNLIETLFDEFNALLNAQGFVAKAGSIVDASIVDAPRQRNTREDNARIKQGERPASFDENPAKGRQKDTDARWINKYQSRHFGYKNHINVDVEHKLIRKYAVSHAAVHDSQMIETLLEDDGGGGPLYADKAYRSASISELVRRRGYDDRVHDKGRRNRPLDDAQCEANRRKSKIRARVEHVFGRQAQALGGKLIRSIGIARATVNIGLRNLAYNIDRYARLLIRRLAAP